MTFHKMSLAFALEAKSEHPLAKAIVEEGKREFDTVIAGVFCSSGKWTRGNGKWFSYFRWEVIHWKSAISRLTDKKAGLLKWKRHYFLFAKDKQFLGIIDG